MKTLLSPGLIAILLLPTCFAYAQIDVLTQHNNLYRTGWNNQETSLTTANVNTKTFGKLFTHSVDDQIYAQPLVVTGVNMPGVGIKNIVYVATVKNTLYAFDSEDSTIKTPYWQVNLTLAGMRPPNKNDMQPLSCGGVYRDFSGNFGIVGTPVIDKSAGTLYVVVRSTDGTVHKQVLHALDITTGIDRRPAVEIKAQVPGTGDNSGTITSHVVNFDPKKQNQRPGLLLLNGIVYIGYASHCDWDYYHGWLIGYDATTLAQKIVFNTSPNAQEGGIWMSGAAPSADELGNIYVATGNAEDGINGVSEETDPTNLGESALKLTPNLAKTSLSLSSSFRPYNFVKLDANDLDMGPIELMLIPNSTRALTGGKNGNLYLMDRNNMGGFNPGGPDLVAQRIELGSSAYLHSSFAYYKGASSEYVYAFSENNLLKAFPFSGGNNGLFGTPVLGGMQGSIGYNGVFMAVSSNGSDDSSAILWVSHADGGCNANVPNPSCPGILSAIRASNVTSELWNSDMIPKDTVGQYAKNVCPTVANGKVYLATFSNKLVVYGLTNVKQSLCNTTNRALNKTAVASSSQTSLTPAMAFDGNLSTNWISGLTDAEYIYVDLGGRFDLCGLVVHWGTGFGKDFDIQVSDNAATWKTLSSVRANTQMDDTLFVQGSGRYVRLQGITRGNSGSGYMINEMQVFGRASNTCLTPSGLSSGNITQNSADLTWQAVPGATRYTINYKTVTFTSWTATSTATNTKTLNPVSCGTDYLYEVAAVCPTATSSFSNPAGFSTSVCNSGCLLPTRWSAVDIGAVGMAGSSCYAGGVFSIRGSGNEEGSTGDGFQYANQILSSDEQIIARVVTLDATNPNADAGLMIRETINPGSRFASISLTNGKAVIFSCRSLTGGATAIVNGVNYPSLPYYAKMVKEGTSYSAYVSPNGLSWTQIGSTVDLGFGAGQLYDGLAVSSKDNLSLATATIDNFSASAVALPVKLVSFTAENINNQYVSLHWSTAIEQNNAYFEVERSENGSEFKEMLVVKAAGNSNSLQYYSSEDSHPTDGVNYYRLKQVDLDGKTAYSPVIMVRFGKQGAPLLFPNPARTFFTIVSGQEPVKEIILSDVIGKNIKLIFNPEGASTLTSYCGNLAAGVYIVQIRTSKRTYQQKLIIQ